MLHRLVVFSLMLLFSGEMIFSGRSASGSVPLSSLSPVQLEELRINSIGPLKACPGDTVRLKIRAWNNDITPPMLDIDVDAPVRWEVSPGSGIVLNRASGTFVIDRNVKDGAVYTISARLRSRSVVKPNRLYVYTRSGNPFSGSWRENGGDIQELVFSADGTFSVTAHPFEVYKDYWGRYSYDLSRQVISFVMVGGNKKPDDVDLQGFFRFDNAGDLVLESICFGTLFPGEIVKSSYIFKRYAE